MEPFMRFPMLIMQCLSRWSLHFRGMIRDGVIIQNVSNEYKGSSSMPHKINPTDLEKINGLARVVRANYVAFIEGIEIWDDRDISHSSVERIVIPDTFHIAMHAVTTMKHFFCSIAVDRDRCRQLIEENAMEITAQHRMYCFMENDPYMSRQKAYRCAREHRHVDIGEAKAFLNSIDKDNFLNDRMP